MEYPTWIDASKEKPDLGKRVWVYTGWDIFIDTWDYAPELLKLGEERLCWVSHRNRLRPGRVQYWMPVCRTEELE